MAKVTIDYTVQTLKKGQSVYIPLSSRHRLENRDNFPMLLIEVQIGNYLGEDDIVRYEDLYSSMLNVSLCVLYQCTMGSDKGQGSGGWSSGTCI